MTDTVKPDREWPFVEEMLYFYGDGISLGPSEQNARMSAAFLALIDEMCVALGSPGGDGIVFDCTPKTRRGWEKAIRMAPPYGDGLEGKKYKNAVVDDSRRDTDAVLVDVIARKGSHAVTLRNIKTT